MSVESVGAGGTEAAAEGQWVMVTAAVTRTLPAVSSTGMAICYYSTGANVITIDANASDAIILDGVPLDDGDSIDSSGAAGDFICLLNHAASGWVTLGRKGTWIDGGPS